MPLRRLIPILPFAAVAFAATWAPAQSSPNLPAEEASPSPLVRLEATNGKTHFQLGDLITLDLVFADPWFIPAPEGTPPLTPIQRAREEKQPGQHTVNSTDYGDLADTINITPSAGWIQWQEHSGHDYMSEAGLTDQAIHVTLVLNQGYVFREAGHYEVNVTTYRLDGKPIKTNAVGLDLTARSADDERELVRRLDGRIASGTDNDRKSAAEQLAALPGDDAVRAKVRWLLADDEDVESAMTNGLAASRNYDLQLQLLQAAWRDPKNVPDSNILSAIVATRMYRSGETLPGWHMIVMPKPPDAATLRRAEEHNADIQTIVDSLPQRSGANLTDTAYFLMEYAGADAAQQAAVRPLAVAEFGHMDPMEQGMLLQTAWARIRDPGLVPSLRAMLDQPPAKFVGYGDALERLLELDPASAKPYVVREICNPHSGVQMKQMAALPDATLPETDVCLLQQMAANASLKEPGGVTPWPEKALITARFASEAIYPQMLTLYRAHPEWNDTVRGATIAYLVRWHPETALDLLPLSTFTKYSYALYVFNEVLKAQHATYPKPLHLALREQLAHGSDVEATEAMATLTQFGNQDDVPVAMARLDQVVAEWNGRESELLSQTPDAKAQCALQLRQLLVMQLGLKQSVWSLTDAERQHAQRLCLGAECASQKWDREDRPASM